MTGQQLLRRAWHWYAQTAGVTAIAAAVSYGVIEALSHDGPVVQVVEGPTMITRAVPYRGVLGYRLATRRLESCEGNIVFTFRRESPGVSVVITRPVTATEIRPTTNAVVHVELPDSVYPGRWRFDSVVDSQCPTRSRQDVMAAFEIEVTDVNADP